MAGSCGSDGEHEAAEWLIEVVGRDGGLGSDYYRFPLPGTSGPAISDSLPSAIRLPDGCRRVAAVSATNYRTLRHPAKAHSGDRIASRCQ